MTGSCFEDRNGGGAGVNEDRNLFLGKGSHFVQCSLSARRCNIYALNEFTKISKEERKKRREKSE